MAGAEEMLSRDTGKAGRQRSSQSTFYLGHFLADAASHNQVPP